MARIPKENQ